MPLLSDKEQYDRLVDLGYTVDFDTYKTQRQKLVKAIEKGWDFDVKRLLTGDCATVNYYTMKKEILEGCLFADKFRTVITTIFNTVCSDHTIFDKEAFGSFYYCVNFMLLGHNVEQLYADDYRYSDLVDDYPQYMKHALPNPQILHDLKSLQTRIILGIIKYFSIKANVEALKYAFGGSDEEFPILKKTKYTIDYINQPYIYICRDYNKKKTPKNTENAYIYANSCIERLRQNDFDLKNEFKSFPLYLFEPSEQTIKEIVKNRFIADGKLFFLTEQHMFLNTVNIAGVREFPEYTDQIRSVLAVFIDYINKCIKLDEKRGLKV